MRTADERLKSATRGNRAEPAATPFTPQRSAVGSALAIMPISGEILAPDASVVVAQLPARIKLHRDEHALPAEVIMPGTADAVMPVSIPSAPQTRNSAQLARRASTMLNATALSGLAMAFGLAIVGDHDLASADATSLSMMSEVKSYTMRIAAAPQLIVVPREQTATHHATAITVPSGQFLPMLAASARFLTPATITTAALQRAEPATTQTATASRTTIAAPAAVVGTLTVAPVAAPSTASGTATGRQAHHVRTAYAQPLPIPTIAAPAPAVRRDATGARAKRTAAPSPVISPVKRVAPTKEAFARFDGATRQALGAGNRVAQQAKAADDWTSAALRSQR